MSALENLVRAAMGAGVACFTDKVRTGEFDATVPITHSFGAFPADFLRLRADLVEAVRDELAAEK